jgi:SP family arabinose:H+ symporter-like MFS transporter
MTVPVLLQWVANAVVVLVLPYAFHQIGKAVTFGFLALMALLQGIFTWLYVPETRNMPLEEIEHFWIGSSPSPGASFIAHHCIETLSDQCNEREPHPNATD